MPDSETSNPYEPPSADLGMHVSGNQVRREGNHLVVPKGWVSPPICLFTGVTEPLTPLRQARLSWLHPAWLLLLLLTPFALAMVGFFVVRIGTLFYFQSKSHERSYGRRVNIARGMLVLGVVFLISGVGFELIFFFPVGLVFLTISGCLAATWCRPVKCAKIEGNSIWLSGIPAEVQDIIVEAGNNNWPENRPNFAHHWELSDTLLPVLPKPAERRFPPDLT